MSESIEKLEAIFQAAVELDSPGLQEAYLDRACAGEPGLRRQVEELLKAATPAEAVFEARAAMPACVGSLWISPVLEQIGSLIGRYKLREKIGEGGCGVVYVAEQEEPVRRKVALKVIKLGMDTKSVIGRFEAERQALAMMDHANIAKVLDAGATETGRPYFVMELVRGLRITDYCDQNHLSTQERLRLFIQVCHAVQHAHQKGIIHRDLKPANILVTFNDGVAVPKVIDFGIAKATEGRLTDRTVYTEMHQFIGTPAYMSPEQAELTSVDIDTRSDIYSLGVLLYELLTGGTPFDQQELLKVGLDTMRRIILAKEPPRPSTRLSTLGALDMASVAKSRQSEAPKLIHMVRGDLDWIVMKCLEKDRARRYETANGLAADLNRHLDNEPVVARPPSAAYRVQKFVRRNRGMVTAAATVAAVLVLGIFATTWQAIRATQAKREQSRLRQRAEAQGYVANMNLARPAWERNNMARLRELLDETASYPNRGFEWYYWQRQMQLDLMTLHGHRAAVSSVAFSPDGKRILTGSYDHTAKVWDAAGGSNLLTLIGHESGIYSAAFSPDGKRIMTASFDQTVKVWDADSAANLLTIKLSGRFQAVALSPNGQRIVAGGEDGQAAVCDVPSGNELFPLKGHSTDVTAVAFSPDGKRIATGSRDMTARVWDAATGKELFTINGGGWVTSVVFSPDGQRIATASSGVDKTAVRDSANGTLLVPIKIDGGWSIAFSPDGRRIITGGFDNAAKVWDAASGTLLLTLKGHNAEIISVAFSPDGQQVVTGSGDGTAKLWAANHSKQLLTLNGHSDMVWSVAFSPDGQRLVTASSDRTAKVWDATTGKELLTINDSSWVSSAAFSPDGKMIVTGSYDQTAKVWDVASGTNLLTLKGHMDYVRAVAFSPDGRRIVTGSGDRTAKVWDADSGTNLLTLTGHTGIIMAVAFSPDSRRIATGSFDDNAKIWDTAGGTELFPLKGHTGPVQTVAFSPDGRQIVTGSDDRMAKVWDAATGKELLTLTGHLASIYSAAFSPDGRRIVTASRDSTAKLWDAASGKELLTLERPNCALNSVAFSPDGRRIATASLDGTAQVWEAATAHQVADWQREEKADAERLEVQVIPGWNVSSVIEHERAVRAQQQGAIKK